MFARIDADLLDRVIGAYMWIRTATAAGRRVLAIDGRAVPSARNGGHSAPHLVAALDHGAGVVLGQRVVATKSNEIPCVRELLAGLDLDGAVVTLHAMHTQIATAEVITVAGGNYVLTTKNNTRSLRALVKDLPWRDIRARHPTENWHGRCATRTIKVAAVRPDRFSRSRPGRPDAAHDHEGR